jgi:hypothetical protein
MATFVFVLPNEDIAVPDADARRLVDLLRAHPERESPSGSSAADKIERSLAAGLDARLTFSRRERVEMRVALDAVRLAADPAEQELPRSLDALYGALGDQEERDQQERD